MVDFASIRNRSATQVTVDMLFDEIDKAWARSTRQQVTTILLRLRETRSVAEDFLQALSDINLQAMEPLIPPLASVIEVWSTKVDAVRVLVDEQRVYTATPHWTTYARSPPSNSAPWDGSSACQHTEP